MIILLCIFQEGSDGDKDIAPKPTPRTKRKQPRKSSWTPPTAAAGDSDDSVSAMAHHRPGAVFQYPSPNQEGQPNLPHPHYNQGHFQNSGHHYHQRHPHHHHHHQSLGKTSSLPLASPQLYQHQYSGKNLISNPHNVSQDSGLSPSPLDIHHHQQLLLHGYRVSPGSQGKGQRVLLEPHSSADEAISNCSGSTPPPRPTKATPSSRWSFGGFFNKHRSRGEKNPPPLPPKGHRRSFQPSMDVGRPFRVSNEEPLPRPGSSGIGSNGSSDPGRNQMNSLLISSEDDDEQITMMTKPLSNKVVSVAQVMPTATAVSYPEMTEPFPPELDFSQIAQPPPPPPRDPRKKLYLVRQPGHPSQEYRPVSFSFEHRWTPELEKSTHAMPEVPPLPVRKRWTSASPAGRLSTSDLSSYGSNQEIRQPRSFSADRGTPVNQVYQPYVNNSAPAQSGRKSQQSPHQPTKEYWKSPPLPFVASREPPPLNSNPLPPTRPPRDIPQNDPQMKVATANYVIVKQPPTGTASPGESSTSSKDSGCSDPPALAPISLGRPLSTVMETSPIINVDDTDDGEVDVIDQAYCDDSSSMLSSSSPASPVPRSPPRSNDNDPGFSSQGRRRLYWDAINEIEDTMCNISMDLNLLDRAERRDLPTAHQELIAKGRQLEESDTVTTSSDGAYSDMDNFMNWNTSSSFENLDNSDRQNRSRTPANRRACMYDKEKDDVIYRICKSNNKPLPDAISPIAKVSHSYLLHQPTKQPKAPEVYGEIIEPDVHDDDLQVRQVRDSNYHKHQIPLDPQPKFGIPVNGHVDEKAGMSRADYLHVTPDPNKYKSIFNPMRNPDTVRDDFAFRKLRKDMNTSDDPTNLGVIKDPNISAISSCWQHKAAEAVSSCSSGGRRSPLVFYPNKSNKLMKSLAVEVTKVIRQQSRTAAGGSVQEVISYEDAMKDPKVYQAVKESLGILDQEKEIQDENDEVDESGRPRWAGKTLFELFSKEVETCLNGKPTESCDSSSLLEGESSESLSTDSLVVNMCLLDQTPSENIVLSKKNHEDGLASKLEDTSFATFRAAERDDSDMSHHDDIAKNVGIVRVDGPENLVEGSEKEEIVAGSEPGHEDPTTLITESSKDIQQQGEKDDETVSFINKEGEVLDGLDDACCSNSLHLTAPTSSLTTSTSTNAQMTDPSPPHSLPSSEAFLQSKPQSSRLEDILSNEENPLLLFLCCVLVGMTQVTGFDFVTLLGFSVLLLSMLSSLLP